MRLGADHQHVLQRAGLDHGAGRGEPVEEAGALVADVHRGDELRIVAVQHAQLALQEDARAGEVHHADRQDLKHRAQERQRVWSAS